MRTALVTGSAGFIGRHFAAELEARGFHVLRCDPAHDTAEHTFERPVFAWDCRDLFIPATGTFDLVVHCAALVDGRETIEHKAALLGAYNLQLDGALFEWALRARPGRIVYFSSSAAYPVDYQTGDWKERCGHPDWDGNDRLTEDACDGSSPPDATYGWVKLTGERLAAEVRAVGVPVTVVRPFSGYGEDQADCYPFPAMMARARRRDTPFDVWGDGQQVRDFIHVDDIVAGTLELVAQEVDGPVNLGTGVPTSMDRLARIAMATAGYDAPIRHLTEKPVGVHYRVADPTLLHRYYVPQINLFEGVDRCLTR